MVNRYAVAAVEDEAQRVNVLSTLELEVAADSFQYGKARLQCRGAVWSLWERGAQLTLEEERPRLASVIGTGETSAGKHCTTPAALAGPGWPRRGGAGKASSRVFLAGVGFALSATFTWGEEGRRGEGQRCKQKRNLGIQKRMHGDSECLCMLTRHEEVVATQGPRGAGSSPRAPR